MVAQLFISDCVSKAMPVIDDLRQLDKDENNCLISTHIPRNPTNIGMPRDVEIKPGNFYNLAAQI